jgi:hypothetical protein
MMANIGVFFLVIAIPAIIILGIAAILKRLGVME